jgi:hypothetical protein
VDDFSLANPPSNDKLLDALAQDFIKSKFDIRRLERTILLSRTYQLSSVVNATNRLDGNNYSHALVRPVMAEAVVDMLNDALGTKDAPAKGATTEPPGARAIEIGSTRVQNGALRDAFRVFGRPSRTQGCDCERAAEPNVAHNLYLMADPTLTAKLRPKGNRVARLLAEKKSDDEIVEELFLGALTRRPTAEEKAKALAYVAGKGKKNRPEAFADVLWALVNTAEFIFNH